MDGVDALRKAQVLYRELVSRRSEVSELDDYYAGKASLRFASKEWANFHQNQYAQFSDNWVSVVADALNERVRVEGVRLPGEDMLAAQNHLWDWWKSNEFEAQSSQGFLETIVAKRSFVIVWGDDEGRPYATWEHPSQVLLNVSPSDPRRKVDGIKSWVDDSTEFLYYYTAEGLWKWSRPYYGVKNGVTSAGLEVKGTSVETGFALDGWDMYQESDDDQWPVPHPMGVVPIVEFQNRPRLMLGPLSDVAGAKDMQDAINLFWAYLFGAADHASLPARVVMGQAAPKIPILDKEGQKIGERTVPLSELQQGRILWLTGQDAKVGEWSRANLEDFTKVIEIAVGHLGGQSRTPAHYFVANKGLSNINGETLIATETPLVKKAEEFELYSQRPMRELWRLLALAEGDAELAGIAGLSRTVFAPSGIRSDSQRSDAFVKDRQAGYPFEYLLEKYGESPDSITRIMEMKQREGYDPQLQSLVDRVSEDVGF